MRIRDVYRLLKERVDVRRRLLSRPKTTQDGFLFAGKKDCFHNEWESSDRRFVNRMMPRIDVFINFGAHHGYYCCLALKFGIRVIAFEPSHENCAMIAKNVRANKFGTNFSLFPVAVSNKNGLGVLGGLSRSTESLIRGFSDHYHLKSRTVPVHIIDDVIPGHIVHGKKTLVLMDIEGSEAHALEGAGTLLRHADPKPVWIIEVFPCKEYDGYNPVPRIFQIMRDSGYSPYLFDDEFESGLKQVSFENLIDNKGDVETWALTGGNIVFSAHGMEQLLN